MEQVSQSQLEQIKHELQQEKQDLSKRLVEHEDVGELSLYDNHPADTATELYENEKDMALRDHALEQIKDVDAALNALQQGTYGKCKECNQPIDAERLQAVPTTLYCKQHADELSKGEQVSDYRPVEEEFLEPPFGRTSLDEHDDQNGFDGEDAWQIVERWGNSDSPAMSENPEVHDYNEMYIESGENDGFVESIESFLATDIYGTAHMVVRNREFERYMHSDEGDHMLEENYEKEYEELDEMQNGMK